MKGSIDEGAYSQVSSHFIHHAFIYERLIGSVVFSKLPMLFMVGDW